MRIRRYALDGYILFIGVLILAFFMCPILSGNLRAQEHDSTHTVRKERIDQLSSKTINSITRKITSLKRDLSKRSQKLLRRLQKQENKLKGKFQERDSTMAGRLFTASNKYSEMLTRIADDSTPPVVSSANYISVLDSMRTGFTWMGSSATTLGIPVEKLVQIKAAEAEIASLQKQLQSAAAIQQFIKERKAQLQAAFEKAGMIKELSAFKKEAYYYNAQVAEYKQVLSNPDKMMRKALAAASNVPAFKTFMQHNSMLAQLFPVPNGYGTPQALQGLQTRTSVQQQLTIQLANGGQGAQQYLQQQVQAAQSELKGLKDKLSGFGGSNGTEDMPDFKPNNQKTKTFWKRIEYGLNIQSQRPNGLLPVTSDIALTAGYKLNDKSVIGIGAGYKMGWGKDLRNLKITGEGLSLRSYVDMKLKGSFWISGGYEYNYQQSFSNIDQLKDLNAWQKSGLIGITKKYSIGKKKGNMQLLWDFLSYQQVPKTQPLKFRIGYMF